MAFPRWTHLMQHSLSDQPRARFIPQVLRAELELTKGKMEEARALAQELMSTRGENCQAQVGPKVEQLNQRFDTIAQRIASGLVGKKPL